MEIQTITHEGLQAIELKTPALRLVAVLDFGPRIAHLSGANGENLLLWEPEKYTRGPWNLRGGHRVWVSRPQGDEAEETYLPDNEPCTFELHDDGFEVLGAIDPNVHIQRGFRVTVVDDTHLQVENRLINHSEMLYSGGIWALTCSLPKENTLYIVPVGDGSSWDNFQYTVFRTWAGHGQGGINDPQFQFTEDALVTTPQGKENKRMVQAHKGIIAMVDPDRGQVFAKRTSFDPEARYPLNSNIAIYVGPDNFMVEMETMGQECTLKPGQGISSVEEWTLQPMDTTIENSSQVESLFLPN
jgi:hypothetical protein